MQLAKDPGQPPMPPCVTGEGEGVWASWCPMDPFAAPFAKLKPGAPTGLLGGQQPSSVPSVRYDDHTAERMACMCLFAVARDD